MKANIWQKAASELSGMIALGMVTPIDLAEMYLNRYARLNTRLNAFVSLDANDVMAQAEAATERQKANSLLSPLDGIPVSIKDNIFVAGQPAQWGSLLYKGHVPDRDDICVERLRGSGAVIFGKTTTPEFAMSGRTESRLSGATRNPWNLDLTPGGSSGGAVAAVAAGMVPLAIGTDAGGSARLPASYTGLFGLRPSTGRVPRRYGFPPMALDFQAIGLIARSVGDLKMLYDVVSGPDRRDASSLPFEEQQPDRKLRIGVFTSHGDEGCDADVLKALQDAKKALDEYGHKLVDVTPPYDAFEIRRIWGQLISAGAARTVARFPDSDHGLLTGPMAALCQTGNGRTAAEYVDTIDALTEFRNTVNAAWGDYDILLTPTGPSPAWALDREVSPVIGGRTGTPEHQSMFCGWVNAMGYCGLSVPSTPGSDRRPIGVQLVGRTGQDAAIMRAAGALSILIDPQIWPAVSQN